MNPDQRQSSGEELATDEDQDEWDDSEKNDDVSEGEISAYLPKKKTIAAAGSNLAVDSPKFSKEVEDVEIGIHIGPNERQKEQAYLISDEKDLSRDGEKAPVGSISSGGSYETPPSFTSQRAGTGFTVTEIGGGGASAEIVKKPIVVNSQTIEPIAEESEVETSRRRRKGEEGERGEWGEAIQGDSRKWIALVGVAILAIVVAAVVANQTSDRSGVRRLSEFSQLEFEEVQPAIGKDDFAESLEAAKVLYGKLAQATEPEQMKDLIYAPEATVPLIGGSGDFEKRAPEGWIPENNVDWAIRSFETDAGVTRYGVLTGLDWEYAPFEVIFRYENSQLSIDWKATTGYGTADFEQMRNGEGEGSEIRSVASRTDFYTFGVPEEDFQAFRLLSPNGEQNIWGYVRRDSEVLEELELLFAKATLTSDGNRGAFVTLSLERGPEESLANQWIITKMLATNWLTKTPE